MSNQMLKRAERIAKKQAAYIHANDTQVLNTLTPDQARAVYALITLASATGRATAQRDIGADTDPELTDDLIAVLGQYQLHVTAQVHKR